MPKTGRRTDNIDVSIAARPVVELGEMTLDGDVTARLPDGRTVLVPVTGIDAEYRTAEQTRGYRYDNGRFHQIGGPTRLTPIPKSVDQADLNSFAVQLVEIVAENIHRHRGSISG